MEDLVGYWKRESIAGMTHRLFFGILYFLLAVCGFALAAHQKRAGKDFRVLQLLGFVALALAALKMWPH